MWFELESPLILQSYWFLTVIKRIETNFNTSNIPVLLTMTPEADKRINPNPSPPTNTFHRSMVRPAQHMGSIFIAGQHSVSEYQPMKSN
jgi:hypothetical protein